VKRRVVVTGIGLVTPCGVGTRETWGALLEGRSGIGPISRFDAADFACRIAGEVRGFDPGQYLDRKDIRRMDTFIHYAVAASEMALKESGLTIGPANAERVGVLIGSGIGGIDVLTRQQQVLMEEGPRRVSPFLIPGMIINLASGLVSIRTGAKGPNSAVVTACATGTHAIGDSMRLIQRGHADAMIAGGAEAPIIPLSVAGFASMKALSTRNDEPQRASRPFDSGRDGFVIGEGAGVLVLEELSIAQRRDARRAKTPQRVVSKNWISAVARSTQRSVSRSPAAHTQVMFRRMATMLRMSSSARTGSNRVRARSAASVPTAASAPSFVGRIRTERCGQLGGQPVEDC